MKNMIIRRLQEANRLTEEIKKIFRRSDTAHEKQFKRISSSVNLITFKVEALT